MTLSLGNKIIVWAFDKGYRVKGSHFFNHRGHQLSLALDTKGYPSITVNVNDITGERQYRRLMVHRFAAYQKYGDKIFKRGIQVRHLDGVKTNFALSNIAIGSASQNAMDRDPDKRQRHGSIAAQSLKKYPDNIVAAIRRDRKNGMSYNKLSYRFNIPRSTLWYILNKYPA